VSLIPRTFINDLLARCDLVELIDARVPLRKKGNNYSACCPFHNEKTPSFTVSPTKQFYHCFGCGAHGNAISFYMDYDRLSFVEAIEQLANHLGIEVPREEGKTVTAPSNDLYTLLDQAAQYYQQQLRQYQPAVDYLKQRGLTGQIAKEFRIGYAPSGWDNLVKKFGASEQLVAAGLILKKDKGNYYDRFRDRIMFPIRDRRGRVIAFGGRTISNEDPKYLNSPETATFHKGRELYGLYEVCQATRDIRQILVVEGYMDTVALAQHGIRNVVATLGTATTGDHVQRLFSMTSDIIFCFDGDRAGQNAAWRALENALPYLQDGRSVRFLFLPEGEDPDSMVRKEGAPAFYARFEQASSLLDFLFITLSKQIDLTTIEGKASFAKRAVPLLNKLPTGMLQHMLFEQLAAKIRVDVATLKGLTQTKKEKNVLSAKKTTMVRRSPMRTAIALLLQNPQLGQSLSENPNIILAGSDLLNELITLLKQTPTLNTAALVEYWRERSEYTLVAQLASLEINIPIEGIEAEFVGVLERLKQLNREKLVEQLLQKANQSSLSQEERQQLQTLIAIDKA